MYALWVVVERRHVLVQRGFGCQCTVLCMPLTPGFTSNTSCLCHMVLKQQGVSAFPETGSSYWKACVAQEEFRFFMEDAGSKLLVLPSQGNAAAEGAAAELGTPTATFDVSWSSGG